MNAASMAALQNLLNGVSMAVGAME